MLREMFKKRAIKNRTRRELSQMSDRDLADIGIKRYDIERIISEL